MIINILDSSIFNRISAGEVIENPSSVVKELIDNSIDAGASKIIVNILDGGIKSIEVIDNGCGIPRDELYKTILPHATSKLTNSDDLFAISTLGFRGEALASISSVSDLCIKTHFTGEEYGSILSYNNNILNITDNAWSNGTSVLINNIFYNTPARYKFLSPKSTEENNVKKVICQYILSNPDVSITFYSDNKLVYNSQGQGLISALNAVYGENLSNQLIMIQDNSSPIKISGYISPPALYKNNRTFQTIVINGRVITDLSLTSTIQNAYSNLLMKHCFPMFVLHILVPFEEVDVNVHPTKREVRFSNSKKIYGKVYNTVKTALEDYSNNISDSFLQFHGTETNFSSFNQGFIDRETDNTTINNRLDSNGLIDRRIIDNSSINNNIDSNEIENNQQTGANQGFPFTLDIKQNIAIPQKQDGNEYLSTETSNLFTIKPINAPKFSIIGQIFNTYLIIESFDTMYLIDQHAFHERLIYDDYLKELINNNLTVQQLLLPLLYDCSFEEHNILVDKKEELLKIGFDIESFGTDTIRITGIPSILSDHIDIKLLFSLLVKDLLCTNSFSTINSIIKDKVALIACKAAIKGNVKLSIEQITYLIDYFSKSGVPLQCPHGRPTFITYTKTEFEKLFKRKL